MYAIIQDRGRQYRVSEGDRLEIDYRDASQGDRIEFDRVLMVGAQGDVQVGTPAVDGATVVAEVMAQKMGPKLKVQRFHRRKGCRKLRGHRQLYTQIRVREIRFGGEKKKAARKTRSTKATAEAQSESKAGAASG